MSTLSTVIDAACLCVNMFVFRHHPSQLNFILPGGLASYAIGCLHDPANVQH